MAAMMENGFEFEREQKHPLIKWFNGDHLQNPPARGMVAEFRQLALSINDLPDGAEKTVALRKLLEAKDAAVRALLEMQGLV